jgi:hypothetical protein
VTAGRAQPGSQRRGLHLLALCSLAILQPLLDVLARDSGFLVARDASRGEIVAWVAGLTLLPPLALWVLERLVGLASGAAERALHRTLVALLAGVIVLPLLEPLTFLPAPLDLVALALVVIAVWILYPRARLASSLLDVLGLAPIVFVAVFFGQASIEPLMLTP